MSSTSSKKARKTDLNLEDSNDRTCADEETQKALQEIDNCQTEIDALNYQASEEIIKIEQRFNKLRNVYFEKRNEKIGNVPNFWITTFLNHPDLSAIINDSEEDCLHHLKKLEVIECDDIKTGYKIMFHFDENPYFENTVLSKEFHFGLIGDSTSQSTDIKWKEGFDLLQNCSQKLNKNSKKRFPEQKSFFSWLMDNNDPSGDEIATIIKEDLWNCPLQYFLVPDISSETILEEELSDGNEDNLETEENIQKQEQSL